MIKLIAHRGLKKDAKENTLEAFKKAIDDSNYVGFECDIRTTKDHVFVCVHDPIIEGKIVSLTTYQELKRYQVPTLEEVLNLVNNKVPIIIDVKHSKGIEKRLAHILDKYNGTFFIQSFNPYTILWFKNKKKYLTGLLTYNFFQLKSILFILRPNYIATNLTNLINIQKYRKQYIVLGYTIKTKKEYHIYKDYADNFICDIQR